MSENEGVQELPRGNETVSEPKPPEPSKPETKEPEVDPKLLNNLNAMRDIVKIDNLLQNGIFLGGAAADVLSARQFLMKLHEPIMKEAQGHPDYLRVTNPKAYADQQSGLVVKERAQEKREKKAKKSIIQRLKGH